MKIISKKIKSKKDGKEYTLYHLENGDFKTEDFFIDRLSLQDFYYLSQLAGSIDE